MTVLPTDKNTAGLSSGRTILTLVFQRFLRIDRARCAREAPDESSGSACVGYINHLSSTYVR